jgi:site-specific recombinase XerD
MSRAELIYPLRKTLDGQLEKLSADPYNKDVLLRYYKVRCSQASLATVLGEFIRLNMMSRMLNKKFEDAAIQDIEDLVFKIDQKPNAPNTKNKCFKILRCFYRWLRGYSKREFPPEVKWIELKKVPHINVKEEDLISYQECIAISEFADNPRDKAWMQCILDAGCRIGEMLTPKISEVHLSDAGAVLYSDGKTGYQPLILTWSATTLAQWLNVHPFKNDPQAPVFCLLNRDQAAQLSYSAAVRAFKKCVRRAGQKKRIWLHLLKHVSCTEDSAKGMPDSFRRYKHHWSPNSRMPEVYEHLSKSIIPEIQNDTWKRLGGVDKAIATNKSAEIELTRKCRRCEYENPRDSKFCNRCGIMLDEGASTQTSIAKAKMNAFIDRLAEDPEKLEKFLSVTP